MARLPELRPDESIVMRCKANCAVGIRSLWQGDLYLTDSRLVWRRHGFSMPFPKPDVVEIPLAAVTRVQAKDALGAFGFVYVNTTAKKYSFMPYRWFLAVGIWFNGRLARKLADKIQSLK